MTLHLLKLLLTFGRCILRPSGQYVLFLSIKSYTCVSKVEKTQRTHVPSKIRDALFSPYMNESYIKCVCVSVSVYVYVCALIYPIHDYYNYHHVLQNSSYMPLWIFLSCNRTALTVLFQITLVKLQAIDLLYPFDLSS